MSTDRQAWAENVAQLIVELIERPNLNGLFIGPVRKRFLGMSSAEKSCNGLDSRRTEFEPSTLWNRSTGGVDRPV